MDFAPLIYRIASRALFAPFGGLSRLRRETLDTLAIQRHDVVLELGCGPGDPTAGMIARGARVHGVDASLAMLRAAAKRAPEASFEIADLRVLAPTRRYHVVLIAFVLHELSAADIRRVIAHAAAALLPDGQLGILDHWLPNGRAGRVWATILNRIEPAGIDHWMKLDVPALCRSSGLAPVLERSFARGRARLFVARSPYFRPAAATGSSRDP